MPSKRRALSPWVYAAAIVLVAWALAAAWAVPALIRQAHAGDSLAFLNRMIESPDQTPVERYLAVWNRVALLVTAGLIAVVTTVVLLRKRLPAIATQLRVAADGLPAKGVRGAVLVAIWLGIIGGLLEAVNTVIRYAVRHLPTGEVTWGEVFWATPLAASIGMTIIALLLAGIDRIVRARGAVLGSAPFVLATLVSVGVLRAPTIGIQPVAALVLALGIGSMVWRGFARPNGRLPGIVRTTTPVLAAGIVIWGVALVPARRIAERRVVDALPAAGDGEPDVVVIIWDAVRAQNLSLHGHGRETTPNLDLLAAEGIVFDRAISTTSWSLPSHASLMTGQWPQDLSTGRGSPLDDAFPTLAEALSGRGYATGGFMANLFFGGKAYGLGRGFSWWDDRAPMEPKLIAFTWWLSRRLFEGTRELFGNHQRMLRRPGDDVTDAFLTWMGRHEDRPIFATLNYFDAHEPYRAPEPYDRTFSDTPPRYWLEGGAVVFSPEVLAEAELAYDNCIRFLDDELARLIEGLRQRGRLDRTLIIVTADHGEAFGEHSLRTVRHGDTLYFPSIHVPMVLWSPGLTSARIADAVSIRDIPATVMDFVDPDGVPAFPGVSLLALAGGARGPAPQIAVLHNPPANGTRSGRTDADAHSIVYKGLQYLDTPGGEWLFDIEADPDGLVDRAAEPEHAGDLAAFRAMHEAIFPADRGR